MSATTHTRRCRSGSSAAGALAVAAWLAAGAAWAQADDEPVPPVTDEDRAAAFPDLGGADARDMMLERPLNYLVMLDHLEWQDTTPDSAAAWDIDAWVGRDLARLVVRSEGERAGGSTEHADLQLLWGRSFSPWWTWVAGARRDLGHGPERNWAAVGIEGLAPYWFELEATAYVGEAGRTAARLEAEYELLLTNRLVLQPKLELDWYGRDDAQAGIGSGLSSAEAGFRLRYEIRREVAPYLGYVWERKYGTTADFARAEGEDTRDRRLVAGIRLWF